MEVLKDRYTITELSERLSVTDHALRYYEKEFSMNVPKDRRGRRYYTPELANVMYQIKTMRDEGLEIKAIKKILQSENAIPDPPPVADDSEDLPLTTVNVENSAIEIKKFFQEFGEQLTNNFSLEMECTKDQLTKEINKTKLELGACLENNVRKLESKLDKHFESVDRSIGMWREKNKGGFFKRLTKKVFR
ncbi:MAG: MerR family transcriptional regulator [Bacillota bacterium]